MPLSPVDLIGAKFGPEAKYDRGRKTTATLILDGTGVPCTNAGVNCQEETEEVAAGVREGTSRITSSPAGAPWVFIETSKMTIPSATLRIGYGMSVAEATSAGLSVFCAHMEGPQQTSKTAAKPEQMSILRILRITPSN